jgi:hypothetical protein
MVDEELELVLLRDACPNDFDGDSHAFVTVRGSVQVKVLSVYRHDLAQGVDWTLLKRN